MKLLKLTATFGCLNHETLDISDGVTLIGAPNGGGKSTWCAFLRTMLYGLDTHQRDKKDAPADKNRYRPWSGAPMEGLLLCRHEGRTIQVRRTSAGGVPMGVFSALDQDTGLPVPGLTGENLGETLTGVTREVFDRSVFLRQTGLAVSQSQELEKRIAALVSAGEEDVSWSEADQRLKAWQHRRQFHKTGLIPQLEQEEAELHRTIDKTVALRQELGQLQARAAGLRRQKEHWDNRLAIEQDKFQTVSQQRYAEAGAELDAEELRLHTLQTQAHERKDPESRGDEDLREDMEDLRDDLRGRRRMMTGFVLIVVLLTLAAAAFYVLPRYVAPRFPSFPLQLPELPLLILALGAGALWALVLLITLFKVVCDHKDQKELRALDALLEERAQTWQELQQSLKEAVVRRDQAKKYFEAVSQQGAAAPYLPPEAEACTHALNQAEREIAQLQGQLSALGDPVWVDAQLDNVQERLQVLRADYDALEAAQEALQEADAQLHARFSPQLSDRAGAYVARLTDGKYTQVGLSRSLEVTVREGESLTDRPLALLSQGTADQLYLALRLAVADLVLPDPAGCPLILDDALLAFDDQRLALALDCLTDLARTRQVIFFTCRQREFQALAARPGVTAQTLGDF